jgi:hypothetical protein
MKENLIKSFIMFGGGYLLFYLLKPKKDAILKTASSSNKASMDASVPAPDTKNAEIVASAYSSALKAGETPQNLTELNKEMTKEFGMRCYVSENNQLIVCDVKGNTILTK